MKPVVTTLVIGVLGGCASSGQFPGSVAEGAPAGVVKIAAGASGNLLAVTMQPLGMAKNVSLFRVNGERVNALGVTDVVRLAPGKHELTVSCSFRVEGRLTQGQRDLTLEVIAGYTYELDAISPCIVSVIPIKPQ